MTYQINKGLAYIITLYTITSLFFVNIFFQGQSNIIEANVFLIFYHKHLRLGYEYCKVNNNKL